MCLEPAISFCGTDTLANAMQTSLAQPHSKAFSPLSDWERGCFLIVVVVVLFFNFQIPPASLQKSRFDGSFSNKLIEIEENL